MEAEAHFRPFARTEVFGSIGLIDSRLTEDIPYAGWEDGDRVPFVSPVQVNLGVRQEFDLFPDSASFVRADYTYVGEARTNFDADSPTNRRFNDYGVVNLAFGTRLSASAPVEIILFARNVANSRGKISASAGSSAAPERYATIRPRVVGLTLSAGF